MYDQSTHFEVRKESPDFLSEDYELRTLKIEYYQHFNGCL